MDQDPKSTSWNHQSVREKCKKQSPRYRNWERLLRKVTRSTGSQNLNKQLELHETEKWRINQLNGRKYLHTIQLIENLILLEKIKCIKQTKFLLELHCLLVPVPYPYFANTNASKPLTLTLFLWIKCILITVLQLGNLERD